CIRIFF
ncbi:hypothetical protein D050_4888B, partial [Vibrio parahaemolyticus VPCR-2009]